MRLLAAISALVALSAAIPIDNGVGEQPEILCLQDSMRILFNTYKPFNGHVYVKGMFRSNPSCHLDLSRTPPVDNKAIFNIPYRQCTVTRERSLNPPGISYSAVIIIQFHHLFLTKVDRAYRLTCFYMEAEKTVTQNIHVSMIPTTAIQETREMPTCRYEVLANNINGPLVRFAKVGDKVFHKWTCASDVHGMLVHSCYVRDGAGSTYELIDERGCAVDPIALGDLSYSGDLTMAWTQVHVFKFADQMVVNFQCQITLCIRNENGCQGITPPGNCGLTSINRPPPVLNPAPYPGEQPQPFPSGGGYPENLQPAVPVGGNPYEQQQGPAPFQPPPPGPALRVFPYQNQEGTEVNSRTFGPNSYVPTTPPRYQLGGTEDEGELLKGGGIGDDLGPVPDIPGYGAINIPRTYRPPLKAKRSIPEASGAGTMDVISDDLFVFNVDDVYPQSLGDGRSAAAQNGTSGRGDPFGILVPRSSLADAASLCMNQMTFVQVITGIVLFFSTVMTLLGYCQRRYYLDRIQSKKSIPK